MSTIPLSLKPCPFCGGAAEVTTFTRHDRSTSTQFAVVSCVRCGARTGEAGEAEHAQARWNFRPK